MATCMYIVSMVCPQIKMQPFRCVIIMKKNESFRMEKWETGEDNSATGQKFICYGLKTRKTIDIFSWTNELD